MGKKLEQQITSGTENYKLDVHVIIYVDSEQCSIKFFKKLYTHAIGQFWTIHKFLDLDELMLIYFLSISEISMWMTCFLSKEF